MKQFIVVGALASTLSGCFFGSPLDKPLLVETTSVIAKRECAPDDTWEACVDKMRKAVKP